MSGFQAVTALTISAAVVFGMVLALLGSLKLALARRLALTERRIALLLSVLNLVLVPMMLFMGLLIDHWGVRQVVILGSVLLALAILSLSARPTYSRAIGAVLVAGVGAAALSTASIVLMPRAFYPGETTASLNVGTVFFALGALLTPVLTDVLLRTIDLRRTLALLAFLCLLPAFLAIFPTQESLNLPRQGTSFWTLLKEPSLWLAGLVFFFYAPLEGAISVYTTTFVTDTGDGERQAAWLLSGFWAMFLVSRLLMGMAEHAGFLGDTWAGWVLVLPALFAAVLLGNLSGTAGARPARTGLLILGLVLGPIFPTLLSMAFRLPGCDSALGTTYGLLFASGSAGGLVLAPLISARANRGTAQAAFRIPLFLALLMTAVALVFGLVAEVWQESQR
jgi:fucose permease